MKAVNQEQNGSNFRGGSSSGAENFLRNFCLVSKEILYDNFFPVFNSKSESCISWDMNVFFPHHSIFMTLDASQEGSSS